MPSIPPELQLRRRNDAPCITAAASTVDEYIPIPVFPAASPPNGDSYTTTIISAFFPPPPSEVLVRSMGGDPFPRHPDEYIQALHLMAQTCRNLILFVPPGPIAEHLRAASPGHAIVRDHYSSIWEIPPLRPYKDEFYNRQRARYLYGGCRNPKHVYGEPHSWAAWNAKAFLVLEALRLDPFHTTHFIWLDARVPSFVPVQDAGMSQWPYPDTLKLAYSVIPTDDRVVFSTMRPLRPVGTEYWPRVLKDGTQADAYMSDIHAIIANVYFGNKAAMARLARAQLILMERDLARGYFVGREEYQLSYAHFEFADLVYTLDLFSLRDFAPGVDWFSFTYWYMGVAGHDWRGLGLESGPVLSSEDTELYLSLDLDPADEDKKKEEEERGQGQGNPAQCQ